MEANGLIFTLIIGAVAGWLAGKIMKGKGFGVIGNIVVGVMKSLRSRDYSARKRRRPVWRKCATSSDSNSCRRTSRLTSCT